MLRRHRGFAQKIEINAVLSAFEVQIDTTASGTGQGAAAGEQRIFGRNLPSHDDYLFPLAGQRLVTTGR